MHVKTSISLLQAVSTRMKRFIVGHHQLEDVLAQSSCVAYMSHNPYGWVYAVRRICTNTATDSCYKVCSSDALHLQDTQTAYYPNWGCLGAIHIYYNRPSTQFGNPPRLGLKTLFYGYESCNHTNCGPNFCCCYPILQ